MAASDQLPKRFIATQNRDDRRGPGGGAGGAGPEQKGWDIAVEAELDYEEESGSKVETGWDHEEDFDSKMTLLSPRLCK